MTEANSTSALFSFLVGSLFAVVSAFICRYIAITKRRSSGGWFIAGLIFGPFGILCALIASKREKTDDEDHLSTQTYNSADSSENYEGVARSSEEELAAATARESNILGEYPKYCSHCGKRNRNTATFCVICGSRFSMQTIYCPRCGKDNPDTAIFCTSCGGPMSGQTVYCSKCGKENPGAATFCISCGELLSEQERISGEDGEFRGSGARNAGLGEKTLDEALAMSSLIVSKLGDSHYRTIREAIKMIEPGGCILVRPGFYKEKALTIKQPLEIIGEGPLEDIIIDSPYIVMETDYAVISDLTIRSYVSAWEGRLELKGCDISSGQQLAYGGAVNTGQECIIRQCCVHDSYTAGICCGGAVLVEGCDISNSEGSGIEVCGGKPIIRKCRIYEGKGEGIRISKGEPVIEECDIFSNTKGGVFIKKGSPVIRRCKINRNGDVAIRIHKRGLGTVENCDLTGNTGGAWDIAVPLSVRRTGNKG